MISEDIQLLVGEKTASVEESVKNLAVYLGSSLTTEKLVNSISKAFYYHKSWPCPRNIKAGL